MLLQSTITRDTDAENPLTIFDQLGIIYLIDTEGTDPTSELLALCDENTLNRLTVEILKIDILGRREFEHYCENDRLYYLQSWADTVEVRDRCPAAQKAIAEALATVAVVLPLYGFDNKGITTIPNNRQIGMAHVTRMRVTEEKLSSSTDQSIQDTLWAEVEEYQQWRTGDVWGFVISDGCGHEIDSCWGLHGREYAEKAAAHALEVNK